MAALPESRHCVTAASPMTYEADPTRLQTIEDEVTELEKRLKDARARLRHARSDPVVINELEKPFSLEIHSAHHFLLLLADSALPLGSFAFSSGLESYLAHTRSSSSFADFLTLSLSSYASTTLPFVLAAHRNPANLTRLDQSIDASIMCMVGRRASVAQGRALLSIWDRSFRTAVSHRSSEAAVEVLISFITILRSTQSTIPAGVDEIPSVSAHLGPLFGAIAGLLGIGLQQTAYVFMLCHVKALLSAAVRASIFGPYQAQKLLASLNVRDSITKAIENEWDTKIEDAGQCVPVMDLWIGRHEMLYSRIFNS